MSIGNSHSPGWFSVAVQALVVFAETDGPCSSSAMAQDLKAHAVYLRRVLSQLVRANLIQAREGRDGGYRLARSPEQISLAEVYQAVKAVDPMKDTSSRSGVTGRHVQPISCSKWVRARLVSQSRFCTAGSCV